LANELEQVNLAAQQDSLQRQRSLEVGLRAGEIVEATPEAVAKLRHE
jgi:hypothetical protein